MKFKLKIDGAGKLLIYSVIFLTHVSFAQNDDSLKLKRFDSSDLESAIKQEVETKLSGSRLKETVDESASQVIVIEGSDIRKFGYLTLDDVLKNIPGFRTSQPGDAYLGETFLARGLQGNENMKFLINGVPVKAEAMRGMPISAQLPIRHAERIEITLGPSSSSYGSDCMAGTINIVLPVVDHPVYAWSDINVMSPNGSDFNLTLGGKYGEGKKLLTYQLFASSLNLNMVTLKFPDGYSIDTNSLNSTQSQLYNNTYGSSEFNYLIYNNLRRESRTMGATFAYKKMEFNVTSMYRNESSALGMNPLVQSYHDPSSMIGENNTNFSFGIKFRDNQKVQSRLIASYQMYKILPNASFSGITNTMSNGKNYMYAWSNDYNIDYQESRVLFPGLKLVYGANVYVAGSRPFTNYLLDPININKVVVELPSAVSTSNDLQSISSIGLVQKVPISIRINSALFLRLAFSSKSGKFRSVVGARIDRGSTFISLNDSIDFSLGSTTAPVVSPEVGFIFKPIDKIRINVSYSEGMRVASSYYLANNYLVSNDQFNQGEKLKQSLVKLKPEKIRGVEAGVKLLKSENFNISAIYYGHLIQHKFYRQEYSQDVNQNSTYGVVGYEFTNSSSYSMLNTFSIVSSLKFTVNSIQAEYQFAYEYSKGKEIFTSSADAPNVVQTSTPYLNVPVQTIKSSLNFTYKDFILSFRATNYGVFVTDIARINDQVTYTMSSGKNRNLDVFIYKQLFHQLSMFVGVTNVFNRTQNGIISSQLTNTWTMNPQYGFVFKFGLTFKLN